jgi:hypothetical protein
LNDVHRFNLYLFTVLNPASDDFYTQIAYQDCDHLLSVATAVPAELNQLKLATIGHEVAHGIAVRHTSVCLDLMYSANGNVMSTQLPYPTNYSDMPVGGSSARKSTAGVRALQRDDDRTAR